MSLPIFSPSRVKSHRVTRSKTNGIVTTAAADDDESRECWRVLPMGATSNTQFARMGATFCWSHATVTFDLSGDNSSIVRFSNDAFYDDSYRKVFRSNVFDETITTTIKEYYDDSEDDWPQQQQQQQILDLSSRFRRVFVSSDDFSNDAIARATFVLSRWWYPCEIENCYVRWWSLSMNDIIPTSRTVDDTASPLNENDRIDVCHGSRVNNDINDVGSNNANDHCTAAECWFDRFLSIAETCRNRRRKRTRGNIHSRRRRAVQLDRICCDSIVYFEETLTMTRLRACMSTNAQCLTELSKTISLLRLDISYVRNVGDSAVITKEYVTTASRRGVVDTTNVLTHPRPHATRVISTEQQRQQQRQSMLLDEQINHDDVIGSKNADCFERRNRSRRLGCDETTRKRRHNDEQMDEHSNAKRNRRERKIDITEDAVNCDIIESTTHDDDDDDSDNYDKNHTCENETNNDNAARGDEKPVASGETLVENEFEDTTIEPIRKRQKQSLIDNGGIIDAAKHANGATDELPERYRRVRRTSEIANDRISVAKDQTMRHGNDDSRISFERIFERSNDDDGDEHTRNRRSFMRYDDLYERLNDVVHDLDERGRAEVSTIFRNTNRRYLVSLYEVSRCGFRFFDAATNGARATMLAHHDVLFYDSMLKYARGPTARWLADRILEELFRVEFYRLYEYLRTAELFDRLTLVEQEFDPPAVANSTSTEVGSELGRGDKEKGNLSNGNDAAAATTDAAASRHCAHIYATKLSNELRDIARACAENEHFSNDEPLSGRRRLPLEGIYLIRAIERCRRYARLSVATRRATELSFEYDSSCRRDHTGGGGDTSMYRQQRYVCLRSSDIALAALVAVRKASDKRRRSLKENIVRREGPTSSSSMIRLQSSLLDRIGIPHDSWNLLIANNDDCCNDDDYANNDEGTTTTAAVSTAPWLNLSRSDQSPEKSEYFALYRALSICDRAIVRADDRFYANIFRTLHHRIARGLLLNNATERSSSR